MATAAVENKLMNEQIAYDAYITPIVSNTYVEYPAYDRREERHINREIRH